MLTVPERAIWAKENIMHNVAPSTLSTGRPEQALDFRLVIDSTRALIHTALPDGYLECFNQTWLTYVGRSLEDLLGWN
jgi:hypothetical protein